MFGLNKPKSGRRFATIDEAFAVDAGYWGERNAWYIVACQTRDSDCLDESNFAQLAEMLPGSEIERANHWLCGWIEYLIIPPDDRKLIRLAIKAHQRLEDYPILDEDDFSRREVDKFNKYAESELSRYDGWAEVIAREDVSYGDERSESEAIESARAQLIEREYQDEAECEFWAEIKRLLPLRSDRNDRAWLYRVKRQLREIRSEAAALGGYEEWLGNEADKKRVG